MRCAVEDDALLAPKKSEKDQPIKSPRERSPNGPWGRLERFIPLVAGIWCTTHRDFVRTQWWCVQMLKRFPLENHNKQEGEVRARVDLIERATHQRAISPAAEDLERNEHGKWVSILLDVCQKRFHAKRQYELVTYAERKLLRSYQVTYDKDPTAVVPFSDFLSLLGRTDEDVDYIACEILNIRTQYKADPPVDQDDIKGCSYADFNRMAPLVTTIINRGTVPDSITDELIRECFLRAGDYDGS